LPEIFDRSSGGGGFFLNMPDKYALGDFPIVSGWLPASKNILSLSVGALKPVSLLENYSFEDFPNILSILLSWGGLWAFG